jgi:hypothetical protein
MMNMSPANDLEEAPPAQACARCGAAFRCGLLAGDASCWCAALPVLPPERRRSGALCLCPSCLAAEIERIGHAS